MVISSRSNGLTLSAVSAEDSFPATITMLAEVKATPPRPVN